MIYGYYAPLEDADALGLFPEPAKLELAEFPNCKWDVAEDPFKWELRDIDTGAILAELEILLGDYAVDTKFLDCVTEFFANHMADAQDKALSIIKQDWSLKRFTVAEYADWAEENR